MLFAETTIAYFYYFKALYPTMNIIINTNNYDKWNFIIKIYLNNFIFNIYYKNY